MASHDLSVFFGRVRGNGEFDVAWYRVRKRTAFTQAANGGNVGYRNLTVQKSQCKDNFTSKEAAV